MIIKCPNCGKEISSKSKTCVHCGYKITKKSSKRMLPFFIGAFVLIVGIALFALMRWKSQTGNSAISKKFVEMLNQYDDVSRCFVYNDETNVVCVGKNGKYGLLSTEGELIVPCEYDSVIYPLSDSICAFCVKENGKYGLINNNGKATLSCEYDTPITLLEKAYCKEYALIQKNGMVGVFNLKNCKIVISCNHKKTYGDPYFRLVFSHGNLLFEQKNEKYALLNSNGELLSDYVYSEINDCSKYEVCPVCKNEEWGFINKDGKEIPNSFEYGRITGHSQGKAAFTRGDFNTFYNAQGVQISESDLYSGIKTVYSVVGNKYGDVGGKFGQGNKFFGGYAVVYKYDNISDKALYGLINEQGVEVIPLSCDGRLDDDLLDVGYVIKSYSYMSDFNQQMGVLDTKGNTIIPCEYQTVIHLGQGLFIVKENEVFGLFQASKGFVSDVRYNNISTFEFGFELTERSSAYARRPLKKNDNTDNELIAVESLSGGWGIVDRNGNTITECMYEELRFSPYPIILVKKGDKWGVLAITGQEIVPCVYDEMDDFSCGLARVKKGEQYGFIDLYGNSTF